MRLVERGDEGTGMRLVERGDEGTGMRPQTVLAVRWGSPRVKL